MFLITKRDREISDTQQRGKNKILPAGKHEVERVQNPFGHLDSWLVVKGQNAGACEGYWQELQNADSADDQVVIEE